MVLVKFPNLKEAMGWYNSDEYRPYKKIRLENDSLIGIDDKILLSDLNNSQKRIVRNGLSNPFFWAGIELMGSPW